MSNKSKRISAKIGSMPGSLIYVGIDRKDAVLVDVIEYGATQIREYKPSSIDKIELPTDEGTVTWINIEGVHDLVIVDKLGKKFNLHPLILEDIINTHKRPKFEDAGDYFLVIFKMLYVNAKTGEITAEQVSLVVGKSYVISFQEVVGDVFDPIRERIRRTTPRNRFLGTDFLAHALIDAVVDHYFIVLEKVGDKVESVEKLIVHNPGRESLDTIHDLKRMLVDFRRSVWPLREVLAGIERSDSVLIHDYTRPYLRDLYEHVIQVADTIETHREMVSGLLDIYLTSVSNKTNEVVRLLTVITTIFIPLTFLVGVYGMNFDTQISPYNMPELEMRFGYIYFWIFAVVLAGLLIWFFRRKKWL